MVAETKHVLPRIGTRADGQTAPCLTAPPHPAPPRPAAGVALEVPFRLAAADGLRTPFTNFVRGYQGLLDYVW